MNEIELKKLWDAIQKSNFDVGSWEHFKSKMMTPNDRKSFYNVMSQYNFDLGDYEIYEKRLSGTSTTQPTQTTSTAQPIKLPSGNSYDFKDLNDLKSQHFQIKDIGPGFPTDGVAYGTKSDVVKRLKQAMGFSQNNDGVFGNEMIKSLESSGIILPNDAQKYKAGQLKITKDMASNILLGGDKSLQETVKKSLRKNLISYIN